LYGKDLLNMTIELPPLDVQKKIVDILICQRKQIDVLEKYASKIKRQHKYLLSHLVSSNYDLSKIQLEEKDKPC
jgi:restriction endonuclease S subunit